MSKATDQDYLQNDQYRDASNLNARMALHQRFGTAKVPWHRWVFDQSDLPPEARLLELGCGPGQLWVQNLDCIPVGWDVTLSDLSLGMVEQARSNLAASGRSFVFERCDAQALPFADNSFDAVVANHMLYHVPNRQKAFAEVRRVLKPGGRFYAATNSRDSMRRIMELEEQLGLTGSLKAFAASANFWLENGALELEAWFPRVTLRRLEETLAVTEVQPLIDYILSAADRSTLTDEKLEGLRTTVEAEIAEQGAFRIDKTSGMFIRREGVTMRQDEWPEFGEMKPGQRYDPRPGCYGLIFDAQGRVALMETLRGCYLPGGGSEGEETPEETLIREVREECGCEVSSLKRVGEAVEYVHTAGNEVGIRKECVFFTATVSEAGGIATEEDHVLVWLEVREAQERLAHGSQRWAVAEALRQFLHR